MKYRCNFTLICCLLFLLLPVTTSEAGSRKRGRGRKTAVTTCPKTLKACPVQGCGGPGTDFKLNRAKNRVTPPAQSDVMELSLEEIRKLDQPNTWEANADRTPLTGPKGEGQPVRVMGYLWRAKREHGEACNCGLDALGAPGELLTDIHMVLTDHPDDPEATSVTAEITPRVRAKRPQPVTWAHTNIKQFNKKFVRVTGFLFLDTQHIVQNPLVRATNWEVHPITKLEVCTLSEEQCRAGAGWENVK